MVGLCFGAGRLLSLSAVLVAGAGVMLLVFPSVFAGAGRLSFHIFRFCFAFRVSFSEIWKKESKKR